MKTENAVKWLQNHNITVLGVTNTGVCVVEPASRLLPSGEVVAADINVWLPSDLQTLRDWMGY